VGRSASVQVGSEFEEWCARVELESTAQIPCGRKEECLDKSSTTLSQWPCGVSAR